ncbi:hypothetical protein D3C73_825050 [compost metagenome]
MLVQVEPAIRATRAPRCTNHQAQHAVAPTAHPVLVGLGQQIVNGVHPLRVDLPQGLLGEIVAGIEEREGPTAGVLGGGCPAEVVLVIAVERRAATGVARIEQEVLHVDRDEFLGAARLVDVRTAGDLAVVLFTLAATADVLRPTREVKQARVIAEGKPSGGLAPAFIGDADQPGTVAASGAALDQRTLCDRPQTRAIINVGEFVQHRRQHLAAHRTVGAIGFFVGCAAVGEAGEQIAIEVELGHQRRLAIGIAWHVIGPADVDASVELLDETRR